MNLDPLTIALAQISHLVSTSSKRNFKACIQELSELVSSNGLEADRHLLRCLFSEIDFNSEAVRTPNSKDYQQVQLLAQECSTILKKPALISLLCFAVDRAIELGKGTKNPQTLLSVLSKIVKLSPVQEVVFGLALFHSSVSEVASSAIDFVKERLPLLIKNYIAEDNRSSKSQEGGLHDASPEILHFILSFVFSSEELFGINAESKDSFVNRLRADFPREVVPVVLAPLLYPDLNLDLNMDKLCQETSSATVKPEELFPNTLKELGYRFSRTIEEARQYMKTLNLRELTAASVARAVSIMVHGYTGLDDMAVWMTSETAAKSTENAAESWNVEIFVQIIGEVCPSILWIDIIRELDNGKILIKDKEGLTLLMACLKCGLQSQGCRWEKFPVELFYRHWKNVDCQYALINHILKNPDVFCLSDYVFRSVVVDSLKSLPDSDNKELQIWRSLDLIDLVVYFADRGLTTQAQDLFKFPVQNCPDVLTLGLLQINQPVLSPFRHETLSSLFPLFLTNHHNSAAVLQYIWQTQNLAVRQLLVQCMADWYTRGESDQTRLTRVLDIVQDLKALSVPLNSPSFQFAIDLACLASRREYLKLEKWLTDKIREQGELFVTALTKFLHKRYTAQFVVAAASPATKDETHPKVAHLPQETILTILTCLQASLPSVSQETREAILALISNCQALMNNTRTNPQPVMRRPVESSIFSPSQLFNNSSTSQLEQLPSLSGNLNTMGLNVTQPSNTFNLPGGLGSLVTTPGSPSRIMNMSNSFGGMSLNNAVGSQLSHVATGFPSASNSNRISSVPIEKANRYGDSSLSAAFAELSIHIAKDVEEEANSYFQRIYSHAPHQILSIEEIIEMLKKFRDSQVKREKEIYLCMIKNLFEEYKFFPQYPDKELHITAQLFGGILASGIVPQGPIFAAGLRSLVESLRKPPSPKMFSFALAAMEFFRFKLKEYPRLCDYVLAFPNISDFPPHMIEFMEYGSQGMDPPSAKLPGIGVPVFKNTISNPTSLNSSLNSSPISKMGGGTPTRPSIANATNIDTLLVATEKDEKMAIPPDNLQDKIAFTFNNLSQINLSVKCEEMKELIREEHYEWLAQYLVMKRASIEQNFHILYSNFLDCFKIKEFQMLILEETYRNIKVLLRSDKSIANYSDRTLLKNLGHWLGMMTLARNIPVLHDNLEIKTLLIEAHQKGLQEMMYVLPFVAKILESCVKSKVFKPPSPWTMTIMSILAEIHQEPELKLNLKFEIEVLCKNLQIELKNIRATKYLRDGFHTMRIVSQLSSNGVGSSTGSNASTVKRAPSTPHSQPHSQHSSQHSSPLTIPVAQSASMPVALVASAAPVASTSAASSSSSSATNGEDVTSAFSMNNTSAPSHPVVNSIPEPKFNLATFNITSVGAVSNLISYNTQLLLFQSFPHAKQVVKPAFERAVQEWLPAIMDRSVKMSVNTTEQIIKKDFALDSDEIRLRASAHYMARSLSAAMALITCRDQVHNSFSQNLKNGFMGIISNPSPQHKEMIDQAVTSLADENTELACAYVQKLSLDKAIAEVDRHLYSEFERRKNARNEGRRYCDSGVLTYQAERMPEQIRLKVGGVTSQQMAVYEEFARNIPGFQPMNDREAVIISSKSTAGTVMNSQAASSNAVLPLIAATNQNSPNALSVIEILNVYKRTRDPNTAVHVLQKAVEGLLDPHAPSDDPDREVYMKVLRFFQDPRSLGPQWTTKQVTKTMIEFREDCRYNTEAVDILFRAHMLALAPLDAHLAHAIESGTNFTAIQFAMHLVQHYLVDERSAAVLTNQDLANTIEALCRVTLSKSPPEGLGQLMSILRMNHENLEKQNASTPIVSAILQVKHDKDNPPGLYEKSEFLLREWVALYQNTLATKDAGKQFNVFIHQMNVAGIFKSDDHITRFFRLCTQIVVNMCYQILPKHETLKDGRHKALLTIDAYVKLIALLVRHSGEGNSANAKINLLNKVLGVLAGVLLQDHEIHGLEFHQFPYHRLFAMLFIELSPAAEQNVDQIYNHMLGAFVHTYHILRPAKAPGFTFAWLSLISHRTFIARVLASPSSQKTWHLYAQLLIDLFCYMAPHLRNTDLSKPMTTVYKGALKVLLVLLHDFPEFLCDYHYGFCDVIPPNCIQMRNLILSAFPRNMRLPDPFTPNLKVDMLPEISQPPRILSTYIHLPDTFRENLDDYLSARAPVTFLSEIRTTLLETSFESPPDRGARYNVSYMNSLVLYVGAQAIQSIRGRGQPVTMSTIAHSAHMDIFQNLCVDLDTEGRYLFLNAVVNQLRYPNSHTHYFSCTILYLFSEANSEAIQEQITRVLLERIIVNRPHPWGLLITFIELIKNPMYRFWQHEFVHCAAEIEKLFESVARSCMVPAHLIHGTTDTVDEE